MELLHSLLNVAYSLLDLLLVLAQTIVPWLPLVAWIAFWAFAVDWTRLSPILARGGIIGVLLIAFMAVLIWGVVAPPPDGVHHLFGLNVSNFTGKLVYVTTLVVIASFCGSLQLSGFCAPFLRFDTPELAEVHETHGHDHHDDHHAHSHGHGH